MPARWKPRFVGHFSKLSFHLNRCFCLFLFIIFARIYFQEGVAIEIAEAVVGALKGELAATAVNAPMVPAQVLKKLLVIGALHPPIMKANYSLNRILYMYFLVTCFLELNF